MGRFLFECVNFATCKHGGLSEKRENSAHLYAVNLSHPIVIETDSSCLPLKSYGG